MFVARSSPWRMALVILLGFALISLGVWRVGFAGSASPPGTPVQIVGWLGLVFFGAATAALIRRLFASAETISISAAGIHYQPWFKALMPWHDISNITLHKVQGQDFMCLHLRDRSRHPLAVPWRHPAVVKDSLGEFDAAISTLGTDRRFDELVAAVHLHWQRPLR